MAKAAKKTATKKRSVTPTDQKLVLPAIRGKVLGVRVYRGFAKLSELAGISRADIYDASKNPKGTQRDLIVNHAKDAYRYVKERKFGFWPEVFLCARDAKSLKFIPDTDDEITTGKLEISVDSNSKIAISRIDGNHRLHFADGKISGYDSIEKTSSFCIAYAIDREQEIQLFRDINDNQKSMSTSHLDGIEVRLSKEDQLKQENPELYIAKKLDEDAKSPFHKMLYDGGVKPTKFSIPLRSLRTGIEYMFTRSTELPRIQDVDAKYILIRNAFDAFKKWLPKAWEKPREYIVLRGSGLWAMCFICSHLIDKMILKSKHSASDMLDYLKSGKEWDWTNKGSFQGLGGRGGASKISMRVTEKLKDDESISTEELTALILKKK